MADAGLSVCGRGVSAKARRDDAAAVHRFADERQPGVRPRDVVRPTAANRLVSLLPTRHLCHLARRAGALEPVESALDVSACSGDRGDDSCDPRTSAANAVCGGWLSVTEP